MIRMGNDGQRGRLRFRSWGMRALRSGLGMAMGGVVMSISAASIQGQSAGTTGASADASAIRVGLIGLDTSHAGAFTKIIRDAPAGSPVSRLSVVAAFPGGSMDIPSSADRVEGYTKELLALGVEMTASVEELVEKVDAVILTSVDGRTHLRQALPVFRAKKRMFIDKPLAGDLADAMAIERLGKAHESLWFTASSLRFTPTIWRYRTNTHRKVLGAHAWSPCALEPHHTDLTWYGIHGIEALFTAMGMGCEEVSRTKTEGADVVVGRWDEGRIGVFRGIRSGTQGYGLTVFGADFIEADAKYEGYEPLVAQIATFFAGGDPPVSNAESIEMMAFMQAAQKSSDQGGGAIRIASVLEEAETAAEARIRSVQP
jgi:hypothetical protein